MQFQYYGGHRSCNKVSLFLGKLLRSWNVSMGTHLNTVKSTPAIQFCIGNLSIGVQLNLIITGQRNFCFIATSVRFIVIYNFSGSRFDFSPVSRDIQNCRVLRRNGKTYNILSCEQLFKRISIKIILKYLCVFRTFKAGAVNFFSYRIEIKRHFLFLVIL